MHVWQRLLRRLKPLSDKANDAKTQAFEREKRKRVFGSMPGRLLRFIQSVNAEGYQWRQYENDCFLTDNVPVGVTRTIKTYNALAQPEIVEEFASLAEHLHDTKAFKSAVLRFARKRGLLGIGKPIVLSGFLGLGESLMDWSREVRQFSCALDLLRCLLRNDKEALKQRIHWTVTGVFYSWNGLEALIADENLSGTQYAAIFETLQPGGYVKPARWLLRSWVSQHLKQTIDGVLLWTDSAGEGEFELHFQPSNLLAALWCLLARKTAVNEEERVCYYCGKPLPREARKDKRFCDNVCRARYSQTFRKRQEKG